MSLGARVAVSGRLPTDAAPKLGILGRDGDKPGWVAHTPGDCRSPSCGATAAGLGLWVLGGGTLRALGGSA